MIATVTKRILLLGYAKPKKNDTIKNERSWQNIPHTFATAEVGHLPDYQILPNDAYVVRRHA
jgi:hypothetical protein